MTVSPGKPRRSRRLVIKIVLAIGVTAVGLLGVEAVVRVVDGYRLLAPRLQPISGHVGHDASAASDLAAFLAGKSVAAAALDPAWFDTSPAPLPRRELPAAMAESFAAGYHNVLLYQWNEVLLRSTWVKGKGPGTVVGIRLPDLFYVFAPVDADPWPRYRYPGAVSLPTGLTLNSFGFRGREVAVDKPERTIRIACVGASTTVDEHWVPQSYPELLDHFLQQWARRHHPELAIEVLNAGCEGYYSIETVRNVRHYVLPLAVDYVVYYEGANQCQKLQAMRHVRLDEAEPPPPPTVGLFGATATTKEDRSWFFDHSAAARRLHTVLARGQRLAEPAKPAQRLELPDGLGEDRIDLARADELLGLGDILRDLGTIRREVEAARARLLLCSFKWFVHDGLELDPVRGEQVYRHLNESMWPVSYANLRRLTDLQNRWFAAWAAANDVDFLDVAAAMPATTGSTPTRSTRRRSARVAMPGPPARC
ncbi:MAG: hypothetical protein KDC98_15110 [Planctomycetes bacterium]|nr:hypothetical protein [Planctomycetota bacterium]